MPEHDPTASSTIPIVEEEVRVLRSLETTGALRVRVQTDRRTRSVTEPLLSQSVSAERVPRGIFVDERRDAWADGDVIVVPVYQEVLVKRILLVEEVRLTPTVTVQQETQSLELESQSAVVERQQADGTWREVPDGNLAKSGEPAGLRLDSQPHRRLPMQQTIVGVFDSAAEAEKAVAALTAGGVARDRVQVSERPGASSAGSTADRLDASADEGMMSSIKHFFEGLFGDEHEHAAPYAEAVRRGGSIVKVNVDTDEELRRASEALDNAGAVDIEERANTWRSEGWKGGGEAAAGSATWSDASSAGAQPRADSASESGTIPVIREELEVGKRTVGTGGVRVFARTVSEPVNESVNLRSERAEVTRRPADRAATEAELGALKDRTIEVLETAEKAVVSKTARVVEEVSVGKKVENTTENISDSVRHTEVEVQRLQGDKDFDRQEQGFRSDFQDRYGSTGASYSDYEPAYRYGHGLRNDDRYAGRQWDDIEPDARRDWESKNPGSAWEKSKDAVRHAWDSMTR